MKGRSPDASAGSGAWQEMDLKALMFGIELPVTLHLYVVACSTTIFDVATSICASIDVVMKITRGG